MRYFKENLEIDETKYIPTPSCFWDPSPRFTKRWIDLGYTFHETNIWYLSPEKYKVLLQKMKDISDTVLFLAYQDYITGENIIVDGGRTLGPTHR